MWSLIIPIEEIVEVTPSDTTLYNPPLRALYVGVSGAVKIIDLKGNTRTMGGLAAGVWHPVRAVKVFSTDTTATGILGGR